MYERWLSERGSAQFGEPLDHGDETGAPGFEADVGPAGRSWSRLPDVAEAARALGRLGRSTALFDAEVLEGLGPSR